MASNNKPMIFIIFTKEGLIEAEPEIRHQQAGLWLNPDLIDSPLSEALKQSGIVINALPEQIDPNKEKTVLAMLAYVEKLAPKTEIFIEYI